LTSNYLKNSVVVFSLPTTQTRGNAEYCHILRQYVWETLRLDFDFITIFHFFNKQKTHA